jgi:hypothetical protein
LGFLSQGSIFNGLFDGDVLMQIGDAKDIYWGGKSLDADLPFIGSVNRVCD